VDAAEACAVDWLAEKQMRAERFSKGEMRQSRTPDFRVFRGGEFLFYCEVKHVEQDRWLEMHADGALPGQIVGGARPDPTFNRLTDDIHNAFQQFDAVNPGRQSPNVLFLFNSDRQCGMTDLLAVLEGNLYAADGVVEPCFRNYSEGRIKDEKFAIDLYIFWNCRKVKKPQYYWTGGSRFYAQLCEYFGSDPTSHRQLPSENPRWR